MHCLRTILLALVLALAAAPHASAGDAKFRMPEGPAYEGTPIIVVVEVVDAASPAPPTVPEIKGASVRVTERGRQSRTEIRNGRTRSSASVTYAIEITPDAAGPLAIPAIEVPVDGRVVRSEPLVVDVQRSDAGELLSAEAYGQPPEVTIGEPLELVLRIAIKPFKDRVHGQLNEADMWMLVDVANSSWGVFETEIAMLRQRNEAPRVQQEVRNGERMFVYEVSKRIFPPKAGTPDIGEVRIRMTYPMALREVQGLFLERQLTISQSRPLSVSVKPADIEVLPLPDAGKPASFTGAVGRYAIAVTAKPTEVAVGDPITLTLTITDLEGGANLESLQPPALAAQADLAKDFRVPTDAISGVVSGNAKRFTLTVRPLRAGTPAVPAVEFSSFDPKSRAYATVRSQPVPITVTPGSQMDLSKIVSADGSVTTGPAAAREATEVAGGLVADMPLSEAMLADDRAELGATGALALALPPAFAAVALAWRMRRDRHAGDAGLARRSGARRAAERRLGAAADAAAVGAAVTGYAEDMLGCPQGTLTRGDLDARLRAAGVGEDVRQRMQSLLVRCERGRYAGGADAVETLRGEARSAIETLASVGLGRKGAAS